MNIDILAESVVIPIAILYTLLLSILISHLYRETKRDYLAFAVAIALGASFLLELFFHFSYPSDQLPWMLWLMFFPLFLSIFLAPLFLIGVKKPKRKKKKKNSKKPDWANLKLLSVLTILPSLLFTLVLVNNYYRFYPDLYSVLGLQSREFATAAQNATYLQFSNPTNNKYDQLSIEQSLYSQENANTKGTVEAINIPGIKSKFKARSGYLYIPEIANSPGRLNLPVIVLLAGVPGLTQNTLDGMAVQSTMDEFARVHRGITPYVFMLDDTGSINNDTECVDSPRGNVETYLTVDVPAYIKSHFEVTTNSSGWAIGGLSMGGMCGAMITLRHPDVYSAFLDFGGESGPEVGSESETTSALFKSSEKDWQQHQINILLAEHKYPNVGGYFVTARSDNLGLVNSIHNNYYEAKNAGVSAIYESINGNHTFSVWQQAFKDSIPWLSNRLGATICSTSCK